MEEDRVLDPYIPKHFEEQVLLAYREMITAERQLQLLAELEDEAKAIGDKVAKRRKANQKKRQNEK